MNPGLIGLIIWLACIVPAALVAYPVLYDLVDVGDETAAATLAGVIWPVALAVVLLCAPFVGVHWIVRKVYSQSGFTSWSAGIHRLVGKVCR